MARKKKKVVHWSKLPRTKLIAMVKRLELANAKLKTQLAEAREGALKYHSVQHVNPATVQTPNAKTIAAMQEAAEAPIFRGHFPWEKK